MRRPSSSNPLMTALALGLFSQFASAEPQLQAWLDQQVLPLVDLVLYDLKILDAERHHAATGVANDRILDNALLAGAGLGSLVRAGGRR